MDESTTRITLPITNQCQTYEIDLADFETADLSRLRNVLGFVFLGNEQQAFSVRNVKYLRTD
jgi:hypothetical protein